MCLIYNFITISIQVHILKKSYKSVIIRSLFHAFFKSLTDSYSMPFQEVFNKECEFLERIHELGYNTYASRHHSTTHHSGSSGRGHKHRAFVKKQWYVSINGKGRPRRGFKTKSTDKASLFLPRVLGNKDHEMVSRLLESRQDETSHQRSHMGHAERRSRRHKEPKHHGRRGNRRKSGHKRKTLDGQLE